MQKQAGMQRMQGMKAFSLKQPVSHPLYPLHPCVPFCIRAGRSCRPPLDGTGGADFRQQVAPRQKQFLDGHVAGVGGRAN
jgi:hypothetical protein